MAPTDIDREVVADVERHVREDAREVDFLGDRVETLRLAYGRTKTRGERFEFGVLEEAADLPFDLPGPRPQPQLRAPLLEILVAMLEIVEERPVAVVERVVAFVIRRTGQPLERHLVCEVVG